MDTHQHVKVSASAGNRRTSARPAPRFVLLGILELLAVAALSMFVVDPVTSTVLGWLGWGVILTDPAGVAVVMTVDVLVGTLLWMIHRRRTGRAIVAVACATLIGLSLPLPLFWLGVIDPATAVLAGHLMVIPALAAAVGILPLELSSGTRFRQRPDASASTARVVLERIARRWPSVLALFLTFGEILHPAVSPSWALVVLGSEYLIIGIVRRQFQDRRLLVIHVAGAAVYASLAGCHWSSIR